VSIAPADQNPASFYANAVDAAMGSDWQRANAVTNALLAVAAELRTANLIAFKVAQQSTLAECTNQYVADIRGRLGYDR
jgi:hypothetical protein